MASKVIIVTGASRGRKRSAGQAKEGIRTSALTRRRHRTRRQQAPRAGRAGPPARVAGADGGAARGATEAASGSGAGRCRGRVGFDARAASHRWRARPMGPARRGRAQPRRHRRRPHRRLQHRGVAEGVWGQSTELRRIRKGEEFFSFFFGFGKKLVDWRDDAAGPDVDRGAKQIRLALPHLRSSKGRIVLTSSGAATYAYAAWGAYGASKAALNHVAMTLAAEEPDVVTVSVRPGVVDTEMQRELRDVHIEKLALKDGDKFLTLKREGRLLRPEQPGNVIARLVLEAGKELSGKFVR